MNVTISTKNISLDEPLEVFIRDKIGGLFRFLPNSDLIKKSSILDFVSVKQTKSGEKFLKDPRGLIEARVQIGLPSKHHRSGRIYYAEVNLKVGGKLLRATCQHEDLRNAIVDAKNELQRQIKKLKNKITDLSRQPRE